MVPEWEAPQSKLAQAQAQADSHYAGVLETNICQKYGCCLDEGVCTEKHSSNQLAVRWLVLFGKRKSLTKGCTNSLVQDYRAGYPVTGSGGVAMKDGGMKVDRDGDKCIKVWDQYSKVQEMIGDNNQLKCVDLPDKMAAAGFSLDLIADELNRQLENGRCFNLQKFDYKYSQRSPDSAGARWMSCEEFPEYYVTSGHSYYCYTKSNDGSLLSRPAEECASWRTTSGGLCQHLSLKKRKEAQEDGECLAFKAEGFDKEGNTAMIVRKDRDHPEKCQARSSNACVTKSLCKKMARGSIEKVSDEGCGTECDPWNIAWMDGWPCEEKLVGSRAADPAAAAESRKERNEKFDADMSRAKK